MQAEMGKLGTHIEDSDQRMTALENRQGMDNEQNIPVLKVVKRLEYRSLDQEAHSRRNNVVVYCSRIKQWVYRNRIRRFLGKQAGFGQRRSLPESTDRQIFYWQKGSDYRLICHRNVRDNYMYTYIYKIVNLLKKIMWQYAWYDIHN